MALTVDQHIRRQQCERHDTETPEERQRETHSWPWNTSWDSSAIFHTLTERSLPPAVTQRSRLRLSNPVMASWCPKLQRITVIKKSNADAKCKCLAARDYFFLICHSQSFHVCVLVHVPHLYWAIMWSAVQIMSPLSKWKALRREIHWYDSQKDLWFPDNSVMIKISYSMQLRERVLERTDTGPLCPVNLYRCLHVSASQIMISLFMSPVA